MTSPPAKFLEVGHHYRFSPSAPEDIQVHLWCSVDAPFDSTAATLHPGDYIFVVKEETRGHNTHSNRIKCWKVMTSEQDMGWMIFYDVNWQSTYGVWFEEVTENEDKESQRA